MSTSTILSDNGVSSGTSGIKTSGGNDGTLVLQTTTAGGAATTALTIDTGQRTKFPTTIGVGDATPSTSGSGITFPATQSASTDANTLDDYEEGTWTPTDASGAGLTLTVSGTASYVKIGKVCTLTCYVTYPSTADGTAASIGGFPFTIANIGNIQGGSIANTNLGTAITLAAIGNATRCSFISFSDVNQTNANFSLKQIRFSLTYITT